jgi:hypothetical protein
MQVAGSGEAFRLRKAVHQIQEDKIYPVPMSSLLTKRIQRGGPWPDGIRYCIDWQRYFYVILSYMLTAFSPSVGSER